MLYIYYYMAMLTITSMVCWNPELHRTD